MAKATIEQLKARAQKAIDNNEDIIYDVASETNQIVDNVKHMKWFLRAVMDEFIATVKTYGHLKCHDPRSPLQKRISPLGAG